MEEHKTLKTNFLTQVLNDYNQCSVQTKSVSFTNLQLLTRKLMSDADP